MSELALRRQVQLAVSRLGARLFRVNTGQAWVGTTVSRTMNGILLKDARPIHMGLATGGSDLVGWTSVEITPDMVGQQVAIFTAIELKIGRLAPTREQTVFLGAVSRAGGLAGVARTVAEAEAICRLARTPTARAPDTTTGTPRP